MELRNNIFSYVFDWLCQNKGVAGQKDLAQRTRISENTLTNILNGRTSVSDRTLHKLNVGFGGIFNMQYLRGLDPYHMLVEDLLKDTQDHVAPYKSSTEFAFPANNEKTDNPSLDELTAQSNMLELYARMIRSLDDLRVELQREISEVRILKDELHYVISTIPRPRGVEYSINHNYGYPAAVAEDSEPNNK